MTFYAGLVHHLNGVLPQRRKKKILMRLARGQANITELCENNSKRYEGKLCEDNPNRYTVRMCLAELERDGIVKSGKRGRERIYHLKKSQ